MADLSLHLGNGWRLSGVEPGPDSGIAWLSFQPAAGGPERRARLDLESATLGDVLPFALHEGQLRAIAEASAAALGLAAPPAEAPHARLVQALDALLSAAASVRAEADALGASALSVGAAALASELEPVIEAAQRLRDEAVASAEPAAAAAPEPTPKPAPEPAPLPTKASTRAAPPATVVPPSAPAAPAAPEAPIVTPPRGVDRDAVARQVMEAADRLAAELRVKRRPLSILSADGMGQLVEKPRFLIGRGKTCDLILESGKASREHAAVTREADGDYIEDLNSANGTIFGGQRIKRRKLENGDVYEIGEELLTISYG